MVFTVEKSLFELYGNRLNGAAAITNKSGGGINRHLQCTQDK